MRAKHVKRVILISICLLIVVSVVTLQGYLAVSPWPFFKDNSQPTKANMSQNNPNKSERFVNPLSRVNDAARAALKQEANQAEAATANLVDSILNSFAIDYVQIPVDVYAPLKSRITQAELQFRTGKQKSITEADLVNAFNNFVG